MFATSEPLWGGSTAPPCFLDSFAEMVVRQPDALAVVDGDIRLTYIQLAAWASDIGRMLTDNGISDGGRVAVAGPRGAAAVAGLLATVSLGAAYVPLDREYPAKRLAHMLSDSAAEILLYVGAKPYFAGAVLSVEITGPPPAPEGRTAWRHVSCRDDLPVYVIYTSGSTGWPKGVAIPHSCLDNMVEWQRTDSPEQSLRTSQFAPLNFDVYFQEVLGTLCGGGIVDVMPEELRRDPFELLAWLEEQEIQRLFLPYVGLHMLAVAASASESLDRLRLVEVNTAGEQLVCTPPIRNLFARLPNCRLVNHYGQSESAMVSSYVLPPDSATWPMLPPIGSPLPGTELLIDPGDSEQPLVGELLVAGLPVSLGYLNQPELNSDRFVTIPATPRGHTRVFRTGDLVRREHDRIYFLSRLDQDVKVRGTRVNLLEVDAHLLEQPGIVEAACVVVESGDGARILRAAVTVRNPKTVDSEALRSALGEVLPAVSVPVSVTVVPALPHTASGKIDRRAVAGLLVAAQPD